MPVPAYDSPAVVHYDAVMLPTNKRDLTDDEGHDTIGRVDSAPPKDPTAP